MRSRSAVPDGDSMIELARLYFERCDFAVAIEKYGRAADLFFREQDYPRYLKCQNALLRMHAEREDHVGIAAITTKLEELAQQPGFGIDSKTLYVLGVCASYRGQFGLALEHFQGALRSALAEDDKSDVCYAISGLAVTYYALDKLTEAMKEIYNLQVFFEVLDVPDLRLSAQMLNGHILRKMKRPDQALVVLWQSYELLRTQRNLFMYLSLLYGMALAYRDAGEVDMARMYLRLAKKSADPENLRYLTRHIDRQLAELGSGSVDDEYDLIFDSRTHSVVERRKGRVDFKNQFILLDMLRLFMNQPGAVHSKESLVKSVWKQNYDPAVHDNKIYVTIKRLRQLIEPDYERPKYIFRAKNGYYLNKDTKILVEKHEI